ncbi:MULTISPECIES: glycoside hydrolase family 3 N-terminal domain-containing protein [unclassified Microbacterium]|uniref:glycoside hydrolase family 3 N-terminal domain-containing protein n=1 Tax=unclassified Microbacterium TaxID=2609290 RepID=UPI0012FCFB37|nr:glycoside hydrolase family 3 N-terminal domain-containing protein [Microbacterium sp. MAH-37]MVQ43086.1 glycoside hydrolase family 3 protein [Microbacterium sp. MAH-37]
MRRTVLGVLAVLATLAVAGCTPSAPTVAQTPAPTRTSQTPAPTPTPVDPATALVGRMSVAQQAQSVIMGTIPGADPAAARAYMTGGFGGFILMGGNVPETPAQLKELTTALTVDPTLPPLIATDEEGGIVKRLPWDDLPSAKTLKGAPPADAQQAFAARAQLLADAGVDVNFGIVADVPRESSSFIYSRALGTDPDAASERVAAAVQGEHGTVMSTLKHFPGHGAAPGDSHHVIPSTAEPLEQWRTSDAKPFEAGISAGAELLMFGHLAYTAVDAAPASLSARWHEIARDDLGFDGVMITDDLGMLQSSGIPAYRDPVQNSVAALAAGNDMVLLVAGSDAQTAPQVAAGIVAAVQDGRLPAQRLQDAAEHVAALRLEIAARER